VLNAAETSVALRRYRLDHGSYPDGLPQLVPQYLPWVPIDPFTGRPLEYAKHAGGFELHAHRAKGTNRGYGRRCSTGEFRADAQNDRTPTAASAAVASAIVTGSSGKPRTASTKRAVRRQEEREASGHSAADLDRSFMGDIDLSHRRRFRIIRTAVSTTVAGRRHPMFAARSLNRTGSPLVLAVVLGLAGCRRDRTRTRR